MNEDVIGEQVAAILIGGAFLGAIIAVIWRLWHDE